MSFVMANGGFVILYSIALKEIFKSHYKMEPDEMQLAGAYIFIPWDAKILYGIMCDTVKLPFFSQGPKRGYIIIFCFI